MTIIKKRILRYLVIIVVFSFLYYIRLYIKNPEYGFSLKFFITYIYAKPFIIPFWFLYSYLSFLLVLPVLRAIVKNLNENEYMILLCFSLFIWYSPVWESIFKLDSVAISNGLGEIYILFPILGYGIANVFSKRAFELKIRISMIVMFIINWGCALYMNIREYNNTSELSGTNIDRFAWVPSIVIFFFVIWKFEKKTIDLPDKLVDIVSFIGSAVFCTYLFEDMLRSDIFLNIFDYANGNIQKLTWCIPYTLGIIAVGTIISSIFKITPVIRKLKL